MGIGSSSGSLESNTLFSMTAFHCIRVGLQDSSVSESTHHWGQFGGQMDVSERALQGTVLHRRIFSHFPTEPAHTY